MLILSAHREEKVRRLAAPDIAARKGGEPIVCLTAYTAPVAAALDDDLRRKLEAAARRRSSNPFGEHPEGIGPTLGMDLSKS